MAEGVIGQRLLVAKRQFELRRGCRRFGRIPTELWVLAAEASAELDVEETARQLQVNAERLEEWVAQLGRLGGPNGPKGANGGNGSNGANGSAGAEFVELAPLPWGAPGECQVEIAEPSGRKLCISLKGSAVGQLASLLATLCGREVAP